MYGEYKCVCTCAVFLLFYIFSTQKLRYVLRNNSCNQHLIKKYNFFNKKIIYFILFFIF